MLLDLLVKKVEDLDSIVEKIAAARGHDSKNTCNVLAIQSGSLGHQICMAYIYPLFTGDLHVPPHTITA